MGVQLPVAPHSGDSRAMHGGSPSGAGAAGFRGPLGRYLEAMGLPVPLEQYSPVLAAGLVYLLHGPCLPL